MIHFDFIRQIWDDRDRYKKFLPAAAFFGGFAWDNLTLYRIDAFIDNLIIILYIILLGGLIFLTVLVDRGRLRHPTLLKFKKWYPFGMQFFYGGLFSMYVVFYFMSASFGRTTIFMVFLAGLLVANEFIESRMYNLYLQIVLYFSVIATFLIFFVPIVMKSMGFLTFLLAGLLSIAVVELLLYGFGRIDIFTDRRERIVSRAIPPALFGLLLIFYLANWIPPVPLSLKFAGMYHSVEKTGEAGTPRYRLVYEKPPWYAPWRRSDDTIRYAEGDSVFCFSAVFASTDLRASVFHHWQRHDDEADEWKTSDVIEVPIRGGRDEGYRLYSYKTNLVPGDWRVEVRTAGDALVGRTGCTLVSGTEERELTSILK